MLVNLGVVLGELVFGTPYYDFRFGDSRFQVFLVVVWLVAGDAFVWVSLSVLFIRINILILSFVFIFVILSDLCLFVSSYHIVYEKYIDNYVYGVCHYIIISIFRNIVFFA